MPAPALRFEVPTFEPTFVESITNYTVIKCREYRVRRADVFDVVQEALTKIVASVGSFRPEKGDFDTWARGVALNVIRRHLRRAKRYGARFSEYHPNIDDYATQAPSPERCVQRKQARCSISNAMKNLTAQQTNVIILFKIDEMSHREIGNALGISEAASHKCYERALDHLACCIQTDLLSVMPPSLTSCDEPFSSNEIGSRWTERSHYVVQLAALVVAVFFASSLNSSTTNESKTEEARVLAPVKNAATYRYDELVVHRDAPSVKPEPAQMTSVRAVSTPTRAVDKPTYVHDLAPLPPYKHTERSTDHHLYGR